MSGTASRSTPTSPRPDAPTKPSPIPATSACASTTSQTGLKILGKDTRASKPKASEAKEPWPKSLAERVTAVERALKASATPSTAAQLAKRFARAKPEDIAEILETLATLGRAHREGEVSVFDC
jgi:hypothetical protein